MAAIVGAWVGALHGARALPEDWVRSRAGETPRLPPPAYRRRIRFEAVPGSGVHRRRPHSPAATHS
ncbi:MAG: ADP-ribosylglycohydrolase family protein [Myxococcota bacterium]